MKIYNKNELYGIFSPKERNEAIHKFQTGERVIIDMVKFQRNAASESKLSYSEAKEFWNSNKNMYADIVEWNHGEVKYFTGIDKDTYYKCIFSNNTMVAFISFYMIAYPTTFSFNNIWS